MHTHTYLHMYRLCEHLQIFVRMPIRTIKLTVEFTMSVGSLKYVIQDSKGESLPVGKHGLYQALLAPVVTCCWWAITGTGQWANMGCVRH